MLLMWECLENVHSVTKSVFIKPSGVSFVPHSAQEDFLEVNDALGLFTGVAVWDNNFVYLLKMSSWILDLWYRYTSSLHSFTFYGTFLWTMGQSNRVKCMLFEPNQTHAYVCALTSWSDIVKQGIFETASKSHCSNKEAPSLSLPD